RSLSCFLPPTPFTALSCGKKGNDYTEWLYGKRCLPSLPVARTKAVISCTKETAFCATVYT
ncbi:hypothetical protein, partial [Vibrio parahaemolyticus]|uniref:hypothetical protein n=1 Tax=Vibrio parahaemolyticus TaxID=670 RepID=UPI001BAE720B